VAIRREEFKFVHYLQPGNGEELYDLTNDPDELKNLINQPAYTSQVARLRADLAAELTRTDAGFNLDTPKSSPGRRPSL